MKQKPVFFILITYMALTSCSDTNTQYVDSVNPYMGNISHLLVPTYPTIHLPNSMLRFYPDRADYTTARMQGFPLNIISHRSGKIFTLMPYTGKIEELPEILSYSYDNESITPYNYLVTLDEQNINVRFTPAEKSGFFTFRINNKEDFGVILRTTNQGEFFFENSTLKGFDTYRGVKTYICMEFDKVPEIIKVRKNDTLSAENYVKGNKISVILSFKTNISEDLKIRYGLSYISTDQAKTNLQNDIKNWDFSSVSSDAKKRWNSVL